MKLIKKITDSDLFGGREEYLDQVSRYAARGVLINENLKICLIYLKEGRTDKITIGDKELEKVRYIKTCKSGSTR